MTDDPDDYDTSYDRVTARDIAEFLHHLAELRCGSRRRTRTTCARWLRTRSRRACTRSTAGQWTRSSTVADQHISVVVNGRRVEATVPARLTLADFLRDHLDVTGTHLGCEHGVCGACTVLLDDRSVRACITLACRPRGAP